MRVPSFRRLRVFLALVLVVPLFMFSGIASAQLSLNERNCVNQASKKSCRIAKAQGKDISACIEDGAKGRLTGTIEECITSDPKGKVLKAMQRYDKKTNRACSAGSGFIRLAPAADVKQQAVETELSIIHGIFGSDLDTSAIAEETNEDHSKCQQAIAKAIFKCQDAKWTTYNSCKKKKLRFEEKATSAAELQDECLGTGTSSIPDPGGRVSKKCQTDLLKTINKKCPNLNVFPGCPGPATSLELNLCIDYRIECELCRALNAINGLNRNCDLFDNGVADGSCTVKTLGQTVGVNTHYASGGSVNHDALARLAEAGVSFIRNDLTWASVEKEAGVYDFVGSGFDELVETCETLGLQILFILDYGNPLYGETQEIVDEEGRRAFAAFAAAAASRYGGRGHSWEIWNEPNREPLWSSSDDDPKLYAELIRSTAPALRAADPNGEIVVGAVIFGVLADILEALGQGMSGPRFLETVAATGVLSLTDEVTIHLHRPNAPESAATNIHEARDVLNGAGYPLPVSSGEWGYSTYDPNVPPTGINYLPAVTLNRQASYVARMLLLNHSLNLRRSVIFKDVDGQEPGNIEHHFGLVMPDLSAKPSYLAVSTLIELLGDAGPPDTISLGAGEHALRFWRSDGSQVVALWAEQRATWSLRAEGPGEARVLGRDGAELTPAGLSDGAQLTLEPDDGPIYLIGDIAIASVE